MFKTIFLSLLLLPSVLCGICRDCDFPYQKYIYEYQHHFEKLAISYKDNIFTEDHLITDRDRAIFYSGCSFALEELMVIEEKY